MVANNITPKISMSNIKRDDLRAVRVSMAAIDPYIERNIPSAKETLVANKDRVEWGAGNRFPEYLLELYNEVPTLRSIVNGNIDFIAGDDVEITPLSDVLGIGAMNVKGDTIREQIRDIAHDYGIYGGFALQIIRNYAGEVAEIYYIDMRFLRMNKEANVFYYSEEWGKAGRKTVLEYPIFMPRLNWASLTDEERKRHASSVLYVKNTKTQVYPAPLYLASLKACEIERLIDDFHINSINNQFVSSAIINFNNGVPSDEAKDEIEKNINEKFSGASNAARIMLSWNDNKESATDIVEFKVEDFGERYKALSERSRQQIFTAFRANPNLFGIPTEGNGFSNEEYAESFKLYNRTQIQPVQRTIVEAYEKIYGRPGVLTITPFSLGSENEKKVQ